MLAALTSLAQCEKGGLTACGVMSCCCANETMRSPCPQQLVSVHARMAELQP